MKTSSQRTYALYNHCSQAISYLSILASVRKLHKLLDCENIEKDEDREKI